MGRQMASMHELRDRAILSVQRLLEAQGSVFGLSGYNKHKVSADSLFSTRCTVKSSFTQQKKMSSVLERDCRSTGCV